MPAMQVALDPSGLDLASGILDRQESIGVKAFVLRLAVGGLDEAMFNRLAEPTQVNLNAVFVGPEIE